jgi:hypothetical protein
MIRCSVNFDVVKERKGERGRERERKIDRGRERKRERYIVRW